MAHYLSLDWLNLSEITTPTLLVRAEEPMVESPENDDWKLSWSFSSSVSVVDVPGNHFTMMGDHADVTARTVSEWLEGMSRNASRLIWTWMVETIWQ